MPTQNRVAIILAAGQGTRMKSPLAKVLHELSGRPLIQYVLDCAREAGLDRQVVVVGFQKDRVEAVLKGYPVEFVEQLEQNGTGHAVQLALRNLGNEGGTVVVLSGDSPFLRPSTVSGLMEEHSAAGNDCTVLTAVVPDPQGYGRIVRDDSGSIRAIVEDADCSAAEKEIREINSAIYCFSLTALVSCIGLLRTDNVQEELYLTDVVRIMYSRGLKVGTFVVPDGREILGINTVEQLKAGEEMLRELGKAG
ncbi:MAG: NTP transferase domain-containing protein [Candidatus Eisenbacteria bacterium]